MANFRLGTNSPYYSSEEPQRENHKFLGHTALTVGAASAIASGFLPNSSGGRMMDNYYKTARVVGYAFPFGMVASLRIPEAMSPFLSPSFQSKGVGFVDFDASFLGTNETKAWLSKVTGRTETELSNLGIGGSTSLRFQRANGWKGLFGQGNLTAITSQGHQVELSKNIMLLDRNLTGEEMFSTKHSVNQLTSAVGSVIDENININNTFTLQSNGISTGAAHRYVPIQSFTGSTDSVKNVWNRLTYLRGLGAFETQRFNHAVGTIAEQLPIVGPLLKPFINSDKLLVKNGPSLLTHARYMGLFGKLALTGAMVAQYDYLARYQTDNIILKEGLYSIGSAGIGYAAMRTLSKYNNQQITSKAPMIGVGLGVLSFIGQNIFENYDKGLVAGTATGLSNLNIMKAQVGELTLASDYRRKLEDLMPGITSTSTGVFLGIASLGAYQIRHFKENRYYQFYKHMEKLAQNNSMPFSSITDKVKAFSNMDMSFEAWEKISLNLKPGHDLASVKAQIANGTWRRSRFPGKEANERFAQRFEQFLATSPQIEEVGKKLFKHFNTSSHMSYKGITGSTVAFLGAFALHALATGKLLGGTIETPDQLERQKTGEELIAVRKSRWWGTGGTPYEGGKISYYKPSLTASIVGDVTNRAAWGEDVKKYSPITRWFLKNFTYELEKRNYEDRPYPMTSPAFSDVPFFGKLLGGTIGRIIKPIKYMHVDEWARVDENGQYSYLNVPNKLNSNPFIPMGGTGVGTPGKPYSLGEIYGDTQYRLREASGLLGFVQNKLQAFFTGEETYSSGKQLLAESNSINSLAKNYWDLELGGFATMTEVVRRILPKERSSARERYNPIKNSMPSWLPDEFKRGDPFTKIPNAASRLPGAGYAGIHKELQGINPEEYPLWYRYEILANVAPYSDEYRSIKNRIYKMRKNGQLTPEQQKKVDLIDSQLAAQKLKRNYYIETESQRKQGIVSKTIRNTYFGIIDTVKDIAAPIEYLVPGGFRPSQKFLPVSNVVKDYERYAIYGSETSFWEFSRAWKDYLGPSFYSAMNLVGWNGIPPEVEKKREIDQYFDRLTYFKYMNLAQEAKNQGDSSTAKEYERIAHKTTYGINPFGSSLSIYSSLPAAEKDRYEGLKRLYKDSDRKRVLELLPDDQKILFTSIWAKQDGIKLPREIRDSYSDSNKMKALQSYFAEKGLPREDWIGYNPNVDINDIKLKYIENMGYEMYDFNFWPSQKNLLDQKPYLENSEVSIDFRPTGLFGSMVKSIEHSYNANSLNTISFENKSGFSKSSYISYIMDDRLQDIKKEYQKWDER